MNTLPLILLGGIGAAFFLNKKKSPLELFPPESPFRITKTKFPGYEIKNNKVPGERPLVITDEIKAITYVNKVATARVKDYDRISHFCNAKNGMCGKIVAIDWIYYLGLDLFGFSRGNRILGGGYVISHEALSKSNIVKFDEKFKEYLTNDPTNFNYLVLNYMKYQIKSDYYPIVGYQGKSYIYSKFTPEILLDWYSEYLTKLGLQKYIPSDKEVEFVFSVY